MQFVRERRGRNGEKRQGESEKREAARDQSMILHFDHSVTGMTQAKE